MQERSFGRELTELINKHSLENASNTPDFLLARFLCQCLDAFDGVTKDRERWYGRETGEANDDSGVATSKILEILRVPWLFKAIGQSNDNIFRRSNLMLELNVQVCALRDAERNIANIETKVRVLNRGEGNDDKRERESGQVQPKDAKETQARD